MGRLYKWLGEKIAELSNENTERAAVLEDKLKDQSISGASKLLERIKAGLMIPGQTVGNVAMIPGELVARADNSIAQDIGAAMAIPGYVMAKHPRTIGLPVMAATGYGAVQAFRGDDRDKQHYQEVNEGISQAQAVNTSASVDPMASAGLSKEQQEVLQQQAKQEYQQQVQAELEERYKKNLLKQKKEQEQARAIADGYGI